MRISGTAALGRDVIGLELMCHGDMLDTRIHEVLPVRGVAGRLVYGDRPDLGVEDDPPRSPLDGLPFGLLQERRTQSSAPVLHRDHHSGELHRVALEHEAARRDDGAFRDGDQMRSTRVEPVDLLRERDALLLDEDALAQGERVVALGVVAGLADVDQELFPLRFGWMPRA
jgi:hypothetical protein